MPYNRAEGTKSITVEAVTITLECVPSPPLTAGQTVTLKATLKRDGNPWPGETIVFYFSTLYRIGEAVTDSNGVATMTYTVPWTVAGTTVPCRHWKYPEPLFEAIHPGSAKYAYVEGAVAYPTRISISAPDRVPAGTDFVIEGKLEYQSASGVWSPLAGKTVSIYYNGTKLIDLTTLSDGRYSALVRINTPGRYTLRAVYAGEGFATAMAFLGLTVSPENVRTAMMTALPLAVGALLSLASLSKAFASLGRG